MSPPTRECGWSVRPVSVNRTQRLDVIAHSVGGEDPAHRDGVDDLAADHHVYRLIEREPPHDQIGLFVVGVGSADIG
jgi:hypothetical protein